MTPAITIRSLRPRCVDVPMSRPLAVAGGRVATAPLVLLDVETSAGITGRAYIFCYKKFALGPIAQTIVNLEELLLGEPLAPVAIEQKMQNVFRLLGPQGFAAMALAAIDMACWDAAARAAGVPLVRHLGGTARAIRAYNSCGLGVSNAARVAKEAPELAEGFTAIKLRLGYPELAQDLQAIRAVRAALGDDIHLMTDYNQSLQMHEAIRRARALDGEGLYWIEEPVLATDFVGHSEVARASSTPIQTGENWWGIADMQKSIAAGASMFVMPDAMKIGGVSGWLRAAALAEANGMPMSSHLLPEISAHLLAVTSTAHWLEYVDWAAPILEEPLTLTAGEATAPERPGIGLAWDEAAVARYQV